MVPKMTIEKLGVERVVKAIRFKSHEEYPVDGIDLNDLSVLAARLESGITDADELRDWQNRINLMLFDAAARGLCI